MPCCCTRVYAICELILCDGEDLVLPIPITVDGTYFLHLDFLDQVIEKEAALSAGDNATFDKDELNEQFTYTGQVLDEAGNVLSFDIDGKTYDCVEFTTKKKVDDDIVSPGSGSGAQASKCCRYTHVQAAASLHWVINHNLGYFPNVTFVDNDGIEVEGVTNYQDTTILFGNFNIAFSGKAYLS